MANGVITIDESATVDKRLDTEELTVGGLLVQRERMRVAGLADTDLADVSAANGLEVDVTRVQGTVTTDPSDRALRDNGKIDIAAFDVSLPAGDNNVGNVDIVTVPVDPFGANADAASATGSISAKLRAIAATGIPITSIATGDNNIGNVDVLTVPADPFGANADAASATGSISAKLRAIAATGIPITSIAAGDNNVGNVDVVTVPTDPFGANADAASATGSISAKLRSIAAVGIPITALPASTNTLEVVGDVAHDVAAAGNPVLLGGVAETAADSAPSTRVDADGDATRWAVDRDGSGYVLPHGPQIWSFHINGSSALTDQSVHAAPGAGLSLYVTDIVVGKGAATAMTIFFEEGATTVLGPFPLEAVAGRGLCIQFRTGKKITANTALTVTTDAAIAHAIEVTGYIAPG